MPTFDGADGPSIPGLVATATIIGALGKALFDWLRDRGKLRASTDGDVRDDLRAELNILRTELRKARDDLRVEMNRYARLQTEHSSLKAEVRVLRAEIAALQRQMGEARHGQ